jgi:tyrosinase
MTMDDELTGDVTGAEEAGGAGGGEAAETKLFVRREISSLPANDQTVAWYAFAVDAMQRRPADDPTSWSYQAALHATPSGSPPAGANGCQHGSWFFTPWHRMYLLHFEEILRAVIVAENGPADWALPYWNYGLGGEHAKIPPAFRGPTVEGSRNPLFVQQRAPGINAGGQIDSKITSPDKALARNAFTGAAEFGGGDVGPVGVDNQGQGGRLESTPHNDMHNALGGGGLMSFPTHAALDPIFWLHHCNIDRVWDDWSGTGSHASPADAAWADTSFDFFGADKQVVSQRCDGVRETTTLGYVYDTSKTRTEELAVTPEPPQGPAPEPAMVGASDESVKLTGDTATVAVAIDARARDAATLEVARKRTVYLNVENVEADENPGSVYGIYVNLPDDAPQDVVDDHHVGNISFFGIERAKNPAGDEHGHGLKVTLDITDTVQRLVDEGKWDGENVHVTFRPIRLIAPDSTDELAVVEPTEAEPPVTVGRVSLFYA